MWDCRRFNIGWKRKNVRKDSEVKEKRKTARVSFSGEDAIYGVLERADATDETFTLPISDISEKGGRFNLDLNSDKEFAVQERLFLKAVIGTRNIKFAEPIELVIKWQVKEDASYFFGCELISISKESKIKLYELIRAEKGFTGKWLKDKKNDLAKKPTPPGHTVRAPLEGVQESGVSPTEDASPRSSERHRPKEVTEIDLYPDNAKGPSRSKNIMLIGLVACLLLILSFGYSYRTNKELFRRIHQLEEEMQKVPTPPPTDRGAELQDIRDAILTLNQKTDAALQINRKRETDAEAISRRLKNSKQ